MKKIIIFGVFCLFLVGSVSVSFAQAKKKKVNYTPEQLHKLWEIVSPKEAYLHGVRFALHAAEVGDMQAIKDVHGRLGTRWNPLRHGLPQVQLISCEKDSFEAHPLKELAGVTKIKNIISAFKDTNGKLIGTQVCTGLKKKPKGVMVEQVNFWADLKKPVRNFSIAIQVPKSHLVVIVSYPTAKYSEGELNAQVNKWYDDEVNRWKQFVPQ